ncbi:MAG: hypothetical protein KatS3mg088_149 [Patescibacteria group bacterium]|nr:MAG: hypothetical protein KatS3mg088_149 [Patescibacteria group bacterium]
MKIIKQNKVTIEEIVNVLQKGGLVIMPTETVYGAFVDATNEKAVEKLNKYKKRPFGKPYSVAVSDQKMAENYVFLNQAAKDLYKKFLPGPLTVISRSKGKVAKGVESETKTLGIRIPDYQLILDVVRKFGKPITATSANASYQKRPYKISHILQNLSNKQKELIDLIVDAGTLPPNEPSTVIDTTSQDMPVLRTGNIKIKNKQEITSTSEEKTKLTAKELWQKFEKFKKQRAIVFALQGEMGAGKTIFVKGLAKTLGVKEDIISPTYDLLLEYKAKDGIKLVHIDTWRMFEPQEIEEIELKEKINDKSVVAIEWADKVADIIRKYNEEAIIIWVKIKYGKRKNERIISWGTI